LVRRPDRRQENESSKVHRKIYGAAYGTAYATESGTIIKKWAGRVPVCITYPNSYFIGMSNLAVHLLYKTLNALPGVVCERAFFEEAGKPGSGHGPVPRSIESRKPLNAFELVFITFSFEMDYINAATMLSRARLGPLARQRKEGDPLVVGGGICVMANPEPLAGLFDLFIMGDVEATIPAFIEAYVAHREKARSELIEELSPPEWVYNPGHLTVSYRQDGTVAGFEPASFCTRIERYKGRHLSTSAIITEQTEFSDMFLVEGTRGCPSRCPFCLTGAIGPFVYDRLPSIDEGVRDVGIIGGGVSFHPALVDLIKELKARGIRPHLPSLRMDEVSLEVIEAVSEEVKTLTFGIEAAAERLRRSIGKPLTDEDIYERIEAIMTMKSFHLKLYFMVGLYGERVEDVERIVEMARHIMHLMIRQGAKRGTVGSITVHASPFVPKAATPFQWLPMDDVSSLKEKLVILKRGLGKAANTYFTHESVKYSFLQAVLARGDRRVQDIILSLAEGGSLAKVQRESPINLNFYATRKRQADERFPWDFITGDKEKARLRKQLDTALAQL
jgi:radical SAM superfamily enzyme YgiQ (UPF0313 family)